MKAQFKAQRKKAREERTGAARAGLFFLGALFAILNVLTSRFSPSSPSSGLGFAVVAPATEEVAVKAVPEMSKFRVGDRVRAMHPMKISNSGRGYYNEGAALSVPPHQRIEDEDRRELEELQKVIEGGEEGVVVGILPAGEWFNRPKHWKGRPRPGVMVSWDDASLPIDVAEETFLEELEGSVSAQHIMKRKLKWRKRSI